MKYYLLKGLHFGLSIPPITALSTVDSSFTKVFEFSFGLSCIYQFEDDTDNNQMDWNKLTGFKGQYFKPMFDTAMIGWRWNKEIKKFQVVPYFHSGGPQHICKEECIMTFEVFDKIIAKITVFNGIYCTIILHNPSNGEQLTDSINFSKTYKKFYQINTWFGGQNTPPKNMCFNIN